MNLDKIPKNVRDIVKKSEISPRLKFVETLSSFRERPCFRLYAYKHTKTNGYQCKEVGRQFFDRDLVSHSLFWTHLGGYNVVWDKPKTIGYMTLECSNKFSNVTDNGYMHYPHKVVQRLYEKSDVIEVFKSCDERLKYLTIPDFADIDNVMDYIRAFAEYGQVLEMLVKGGYGYLWKYAKSLSRLISKKSRLISKKKQMFLAFLKNNREFILKNKVGYEFIIEAINLGMTAEEYQERIECNQLGGILLIEHFDYEQDTVLEMHRYLKEQGGDNYSYRDYLSTCRAMKINTLDRGVLFPRDFKESHDNIIDLKINADNAVINEGLKKVLPILQPFIESDNEFNLVIPTSQNMLINWGNLLHCCVGRCNYGERMSKGETIILGVFKGNSIIECCEVNIDTKGELSIVQLRGDHNQESCYHKEAKSLVNAFLQNYQPKKIIGSCI